MKQTAAFVAGIMVAWLVSCAAGAAGDKAADSYYRSPLECHEVQQHLDACLEALGRCDASQ